MTASLRSAVYEFYAKAERLIVPTLRSSQYAYCEALRSVLQPDARWLDLGCGHQVFADWMTREEREVIGSCRVAVGIDRDWEGLRGHAGITRRVLGDLTQLPFADASCDVVSANMVVEHLETPTTVLTEVHRILAANGTFVFHTPNYHHWGTMIAAALPDGLKKRLIRWLEGRAEADVFPTHYRMNTALAVRRLADRCSFDVVMLQHVSSSATLQMLGPLVLLELLYIRLIARAALAPLRSGLVVILRKRSDSRLR
jgi:ubiquinone/menaquinone biosynthesis C-methylase UbiE